MGPEFTFVKAFDWEIREFPPGVERIVLQQGLVLEVKWLDADEYAHWRRDGVDFTNTRLYRKLREFEVDEAIRNGDPEALGGLVRVTAPEGVHIIDHVSRDWLWRQPRPLVQHSLPASLKHGSPRPQGARTTVTHPLHDLRLPGPTLVLVDDSDSLALDALQGIEDLPGIEPTVVPLSTLDGPRKGWGSVLVVAADRARLRRMASAVPLLGQCKAVACWLTDAPTPWVLVPRPEWPRLVHLAAREADDRGVLTVARFASGARAQLVVMEMARQAAGPGDTTHGGLVVSYAGRPAAPGLDARAVLLPDVSGAGDAERDVPPDVVVARRGTGTSRSTTSSTARRPSSPTPVPSPSTSWSSTRSASARTGTTRSSTSPGWSPVRAAARSPRTSSRRPAPSRACACRPTPAPPTCSRWRSPGCRWSPRACSTWRPPLAAALDATVDLDDPLRREEHSLAVRRAAFDHHSTLAWRSALASRAGVRHVGLPGGQRPAVDQAARDARLRAAAGRPAAGRGGRAGAGRARLRARPRRRTPCARRPPAPGADLRRGRRSSATSSPPRRGPRRARCCSRSTTTTGTHPTPCTTC